MTPDASFAELISLAQLFISQQYKPKDLVYFDFESLKYFIKAAPETASLKTVCPQVPQLSPPVVPLNPPISPLPAPKKNPALTKVTVAEKIEQLPLPEKRIETPPKKEIHLEPFTELADINFSNVRKILEEVAPSIIHVEMMSDESSKRPSSRPQVLIISFTKNIQHLTFLQNVSKAIQSLNVSCKLLSNEESPNESHWCKIMSEKEIKLFILCEGDLTSLPKEMIIQRKSHHLHTIKNKPVLILSNIDNYLNEHALKADLWLQIKQIVSSL